MIETRHWTPFRKDVSSVLEEARREDVVRRLWSRDFTLWKREDREISNRLGWLAAPERALSRLSAWREAAAGFRRPGAERVVLLGMGGSSLAPEVFSRVFGPGVGAPALDVLDSTVPRAVKRVQDQLVPERAAFLVSSKSGTTLETLSLFRYFFGWMENRLGTGGARGRFLAITDPGTPLEETARRMGFRAVVPGEPDIGGRFSALSAFGLLPAAVLNIDLEAVLERSRIMAGRCRLEGAADDNPGLFLGAALGRLASRGIDKIMLLLPPELESFGGWLEQLVAESTGKDGRGILPVLGETPLPGSLVQADRLWIVFRLGGNHALDESLARLDKSARPHLVIDLESPLDLGAQFFLWETAAAVACWCLGVNPFDQPDVASAKKSTDDMLVRFQSLGRFPDDGEEVLDETRAAGAIRRFAGLGRFGDYLSLQAFLAPGPDTGRLLGKIADALRTETRLPVTCGYGPRFLHSTGQLHKGDAGRGLFVQFTAEDPQDLPLPEAPGEGLRGGLSFGVIKEAQARGDFQALRRAGRRVLRVRLSGDAPSGLETILAGLGG
jgi:glucose-6-phosphate isomerase